MTPTRLIATTSAVAFAAFMTVACERGPAERAGARVDDAVEDTRDAVEDAADSVQDTAEDAVDAVQDAAEDTEDAVRDATN